MRIDSRSWQAVRWVFRPRDCYETSDHGTRRITITSRLQVAVAVAGTALALLAGIGMLGAIHYRKLATARADGLAAFAAGHRAFLERLQALAEDLDAVAATDPEGPGAMLRQVVRPEAARIAIWSEIGGLEPSPVAGIPDRSMPGMAEDVLLLANAHGRLLRRLEEADREAARLAAREQALAAKLDKARARISALEQARLRDAEAMEAMVLRGNDLDTRLAAARRQAKAAVSEHGMARDQVSALEQARFQDARALQGLALRTRDLESQLVAAERQAQAATAELAAARQQLAKERAQHEAVKLERRSLHAEAVRLEAEIATYRNAQANWLLALSERTQHSITLVERAVAMTGVDIDTLVARARKELRSAAGGPFVAAGGHTEGIADGVDEIATDVGLRVERWEALKRVVQAMPLAAPLDQFLIGSGFGRRSDPLNGREATHTGLDFNAPVKTPVLSTAPGRVTFAGWHREYGRLVEIDHGFGIRTRYAHLASIAVSKGEDVALRETVGLLGSSGRSTGPHLHYEILVDGKPVNPRKFLEAARHVLKG